MIIRGRCIKYTSGMIYNVIYIPLCRLCFHLFFKIVGLDQHSSSVILQKSRIITKQERLSVECLKPKYQGPCKMFQRRKCIRRKNTERGLWKMVRCRSSGANNFLLMNSQVQTSSEKYDLPYSSGKK